MTEFEQKKNFRLQRNILAIGLVLMALKFLAWFLTNSNAILTDALESIVNIVAGSFALYSLYFAARPRDRSHPYGHGKMEFISAGFEGGLIFLAGMIIISKAAYNLWFPQPIASLDLGICLVAVSGLCNYFMGIILLRRGRKQPSLILRASGHHLKSDAYSSAGLTLGLALLYFTGLLWLDQAIAMVFGVVIIYTGFRLVRASLAGILDESDQELLRELVAQLEERRRPNWIDVHNLRLIKYGSRLHIDCHLSLPWYFDVKTAHREIKLFEELVEETCDQPVELFIHSDPCLPPRACPLCRKPDCALRQQAFENTVPWTLNNLLQNQPHLQNPDNSAQSPEENN